MEQYTVKIYKVYTQLMSEEPTLPNYRSALLTRNSRKVIEAIAKLGGVASFSEIQSVSNVKGSVLTHYLNRLQRFHVLEKEVNGTGRGNLTYKTPLCFIYPPRSRVQIAYFGLLGKRTQEASRSQGSQ